MHCTTARSRFATATTRSRPTPGQENTLSTTTAPAIRVPTMKPTIVTVGIAALGKACDRTNARHETPLARRADIGLAQHFQHRAAREARKYRRATDAERNNRKDRMPPGFLPAGRQPAELDGENQHQHKAKHETRNRKPGHGPDHHRAIDQAAAMQGRENAAGDANRKLEQERRDRQRQGCGDSLEDEIDRRAPVSHRASEFTLRDGAKIIEILHPDRRAPTPCGRRRSLREAPLAP